MLQRKNNTNSFYLAEFFRRDPDDPEGFEYCEIVVECFDESEIEQEIPQSFWNGGWEFSEARELVPLSKEAIAAIDEF
jgi:hypothetical protein